MLDGEAGLRWKGFKLFFFTLRDSVERDMTMEIPCLKGLGYRGVFLGRMGSLSEG